MVTMVTQEFTERDLLKFDLLCRIKFGSLEIYFGIKVAAIRFIGNRVCAFWSHNCQLRLQVVIFRKKITFFRNNNNSFYKYVIYYFGKKLIVCVILKPCIDSTVGEHISGPKSTCCSEALSIAGYV